MPVQPSVLNEDLVSPAATAGAGMIVENMNRAADRATQAALAAARMKAEAALQEKALKAEEAAATKELEARSLQYKQYQDFQSNEANKERDARAKMDAEDKKFSVEQQQKLFDHQDKLHNETKQLQMAELELRARVARASAEESSKLQGELDKVTKRREEIEDTVAGLELEHAASQGRQEQIRQFAVETAGQVNASRQQAGQLGLDVTTDAMKEVIGDAISNQKGGLGGFFKEAFKKGTGQFGVANEIASRLGSTVGDFFGLDTPVERTALTNASAMADAMVEKLAPRLSSVSNVSSPVQVKASLTKFFSAGIVAQQAWASDGGIKGADEEKVLREFEAATAELGGMVGNETVQGIVRGLNGGREELLGLQKDEPELTDSEKKARKGAFTGIARIKDVFDMVRRRPGSPVAAMDYDKKVDDMVPKLLNAYASTSFNTNDFTQQLKYLGLSPNDAKKVVAELKRDKRPVPEALAKKIAQLEREAGRLDSETMSKQARSRAEGIGTSAALELDMLKSVGGGLYGE